MFSGLEEANAEPARFLGGEELVGKFASAAEVDGVASGGELNVLRLLPERSAAGWRGVDRKGDALDAIQPAISGVGELAAELDDARDAGLGLGGSPEREEKQGGMEDTDWHASADGFRHEGRSVVR